MKKSLRVSIGIPAYNEERNIRSVLEQIFQQVEDGWTLEEVLVYCDGCSDNTVQEATKVKNKKLRVVDSADRKGKTFRLQQMFTAFTGDVLIMFDGDIAFSSTEVITRLIQPFFADPQVMLVGGNSQPFPPQGFMERAISSTFAVFYASRIEINNGHNIFGATGSILAIHTQLAKKIKLPEIVAEDAYLYLKCIVDGFTFRYVDSAVIYYKLPSKLSDYIKQLLRSNPEPVIIELQDIFGSRVKEEFARPFSFYASVVFREWRKNPLGVTLVIVVNLLFRPFHSIIIKNYKLEWFTAKSTH